MSDQAGIVIDKEFGFLEASPAGVCALILKTIVSIVKMY